MILSPSKLPRLEPPAVGVVHLLHENSEFRKIAAAWSASLGHQTLEHHSISSLLSATAHQRPACLVLGLRFGNVSGLDIQLQLQQKQCPLPVVFVAAEVSVRTAVAAMEQGAITVLEKPCTDGQFREAISEAITRDAMVQRLAQRQEDLRRRFATLSQREKLVMHLVVDGRLNKAIARELQMTERTVERVRAVVLDKVGADSAVQMASLLTEHRLLGELMCNQVGKGQSPDDFATAP